MDSLMLRLTCIFSVLGSVMLMAACAPLLPILTSDMSSSAPTEGQRLVGTLRIALTAQPNSLDCPQASDLNASLVALQLYNSLLWLNDQGQLAPALAERWEISADGTAYTFYLRHGVLFHNGGPWYHGIGKG